DRRRVMFFSDLGSGLMTALVLVLFSTGRLELWHLFVMEGVAGIMEAFQDPAFSASVSLLVPRNEYTRANARLALGRSAVRIVSPALAGVLLATLGLPVVMLADLGTMILALAALLFLRIPRPEISSDGESLHRESFFRQMAFGFRYIFQRPGLRGILLVFFCLNFFSTLAYYAVLSPMILARTGGNEIALGRVRTVLGVGGVVGGLVMSMSGRIKRKACTFAFSTMLSFIVCDFMMAVSRNTWMWSIAGFLTDFSIPFIVSPYYALWQERVPPDVQGRVFSTREMLQVSSQPLGYLAGGILADQVFGPALLPGGALAGSLGLLVGTGPGAGMSAVFLFTSLFGALTGLAGLLSPSIKHLDETASEAHWESE
ncbi:MAG: MFS transporter, partial [Anaerolineaceae bacterium]